VAVVFSIFLYRRWERSNYEPDHVTVTLYLRLQAEEDKEAYACKKYLVKLPVVPRVGDKIIIKGRDEEYSHFDAHKVVEVMLIPEAIAQVTCEEIKCPKAALNDLAGELKKDGWSCNHLKTIKQSMDEVGGG